MVDSVDDATTGALLKPEGMPAFAVSVFVQRRNLAEDVVQFILMFCCCLVWFYRFFLGSKCLSF